MEDWPTESQFNVALRRRLRELREKRGQTQEYVASSIGLKLDAYRKVETRSKSQVKSYLIERLSAHYSVPVLWLLTGDHLEPYQRNHRRPPARPRRKSA